MNLEHIGWNLLTLLVIALAQNDNKEIQFDPIVSADSEGQHTDQFFRELTPTPKNKVPFYKAGTDFLALPELNNNMKTGKNMTVYVGPTFTKEFMMKVPSDKRFVTGYKLLDWKRRRKRMGKKHIRRNHRAVKKIETLGIKDEPHNETDSKINQNEICNAMITNKIENKKSCQDKINTDIDRKSFSGEISFAKIDSNDLIGDNGCFNINDQFEKCIGGNDVQFDRKSKRQYVDKNQMIKIYGQPKFFKGKFEVATSEDNNEFLDQSKLCSCSNMSNLNMCGKRKCDQIRLKRNSNSFEDFVELNRSSRENKVLPKATAAMIITVTTIAATNPSLPVTFAALSTEKSVSSMHPSSTTNSALIPTTSFVSGPFTYKLSELSTIKSTQSSRIMPLAIKDSIPDLQDLHLSLLKKKETNNVLLKSEYPKRTMTGSTTTDAYINRVKAKVKGTDKAGRTTNVRLEVTSQPYLTHSESLSEIVASCVTQHPNNVTHDVEGQKAECHPKGSGPLSPLICDPEAYGPRNEEEVEDALTGKLADRVVEVVLAKVGKSPRMLKELGLYAQGNLSKIQSTVSHPDGKQTCKEQSSDSLKLNVLQEIASAIDKLVNVKHAGTCLKPAEDLADFLSWLLSEDSEMDMPETAGNRYNTQPRREADYLFRPFSSYEDIFNEKDTHSKYNWDTWMNFEDENENDITVDSTTLFDDIENKEHFIQTRNVKRMPRHLLHRKRTAKKGSDHRRRRRYTPWSLSDYP